MKFLKKQIRDYLNKGHVRSIKAKKNIIASFFIKGCNILIGIILVPITINYVNPTQYGIWLTLSSIFGWLFFFDIGFGQGLRNRFAEAIAKGNSELARIYVSTTYFFLSIIMIGVLLLFLCVNPFLNWVKILNSESNLELILNKLVIVVSVFFCVQFVFKLITTIITADQQPAKASFLNFIGNVISLCIIFILTKTTTGSLLYLGVALSFTPILVLGVSSLWFYRHEYSIYAPSYKYVKLKYARDLMTLGVKFFFIRFGVIITYQTSNIIIAQLFGPREVTPYNIAYKYFGIITMVLVIIMSPFWSAYTEAWIKKDIKWIKKSVQKLQKLWVVFSLLALIMLFCANFIYKIWVGKEIIVPMELSVVMALFVIVNSWCQIYSNFLNGVGKIKLQLYSGLFGSIINIPLAIFLGKIYGIAGVVFSTVIIGLVASVWAPIQYYKIINNTAKGLWNK